MKRSIGQPEGGVDAMGRDALMRAIIDGEHDVAFALLASGARVDVADRSGWTALHFASRTSGRHTAWQIGSGETSRLGRQECVSEY